MKKSSPAPIALPLLTQLLECFHQQYLLRFVTFVWPCLFFFSRWKTGRRTCCPRYGFNATIGCDLKKVCCRLPLLQVGQLHRHRNRQLRKHKSSTKGCVSTCRHAQDGSLRSGCGLVSGFFFLVGGGFGAVQAPFWENPGVKCRFRAVFIDIWGGFRAVQAPFWGSQWWNAGFVRVGHEKLPQKAHFTVHFCFLCACVFLCMFTCVCVCVSQTLFQREVKLLLLVLCCFSCRGTQEAHRAVSNEALYGVFRISGLITLTYLHW